MLLAAAGANAAPVPLTLESPALAIYQQTANSPCVIGDSSCNNPAGFGYTLIPTGPSGETYTLDSPTYTVGQIRSIVGNAFNVGVDVNTTTKPLATEYLVSFSATIGGSVAYLYTGPTQLTTVNNGNGYSDALLKGFDLTGLPDATQIFFTASIRGATDGREEFFLVSTNAPQVPEPATLGLLGLGLLGAGIARRRKA
jgi:hypothetical protein